MQIATTIAQARALFDVFAQPLGFVPTMGALHEGHLELVRRAKADCLSVAASLFVNPMQFAPGEDLAKYPRDFEGDREKLRAAGVDVLFAPDPAAMYPPGFSSYIDVGAIGSAYEGSIRPDHFRGVATVVGKLLHIVQPEVLYVGQKDAQQTAVLRKMVRDLDFPVRVEVVETVREGDGLALSSRNAYLSAAQRGEAITLNRALVAMRDALEAGAAESGRDGGRPRDAERARDTRLLRSRRRRYVRTDRTFALRRVRHRRRALRHDAAARQSVDKIVNGARILLGVCGGVAAYKSAALTSTLVQRGALVDVVMTASAERFVGALTFASLTARPVYTSLWDAPERIPHIRLVREAEVILVAPATANLIAKLAHGIADDLLTTALLAARIPIVLAPAMNDAMYANDATQQNLATLRARGYEFVDPERGFLAERERGVGRLASEERLIEAVERVLARRQSLSGRRVAITAGPTREPFDPVRFVSNASTGAMGIAARARSRAARRGGDAAARPDARSNPRPASTWCASQPRRNCTMRHSSTRSARISRSRPRRLPTGGRNARATKK